MSHQATYTGRFAEAANLARAARTGTAGIATATLTAHFHTMEAPGVRHEALLLTDGGERPSISLLSQRCCEAGGSLTRGSVGRTGAASTKSRRFGTAGWAGRGERDGKVYARNRCCYAPLSLRQL